MRENRVHGEGPEGEGRDTGQRYPAHAQADHGERSVEWATWTFPIISFSREPYEAKVSRTGLTGGMGRRTVRQRALCLPSDNPAGPVWSRSRDINRTVLNPNLAKTSWLFRAFGDASC